MKRREVLLFTKRKVILLMLIFIILGKLYEIFPIFLLNDIGFSNNFGSFSRDYSYYSYYENPSLGLKNRNSVFIYYNKYGFEELGVKIISTGFNLKENNFNIYIYHFQEEPYKEEEYGFNFSRKIVKNIRAGINLKLLRLLIMEKRYLKFSYDLGVKFDFKKNHIFGFSLKDIERPNLKERVPMDFIFKYMYKKNGYGLFLKYTKIFGVYDYIVAGGDFEINNFIRLLYGFNNKNKENRFGINISYKMFDFNFGYIVHSRLYPYIITEMGIRW